jgi:hypothetical protein
MRESVLKGGLRLLALAHMALGGAGLALCAAFVAVAALSRDRAYEDELALFGWLLALAALVYFLPAFFGGLGLLKGWPWARAIIWIESAFLILLIPVGTLLAGLNIWVLLSTREVSADGGIAKFEQAVRWSVRPLALALVALVVLGAMVGAGYLFRDVIDPPREQILTPMPSGPPPTVSRGPVL